MELLLCPSCRCLLSEPVTVSCGHSFCKRCLGKTLPPQCPVCSERLKLWDVKSVKNNVVIFAVMEKCCPEETKLQKIRCSLRECLQNRDFNQALQIANEGMQLAPHDFRLRSSRAEAYLELRQFNEALEDFEAMCKARPLWSEGFFRKGKIFLEMGRNTDALLQYHRCLTLDPEFTAAREEIQKILQGDALPLPDTVEGLLSAVSVYTCLCEPMKRDNIQHSSANKVDCQPVSSLPVSEEAQGQQIQEIMEPQAADTKDKIGGSSQQQDSPLNILSMSDFECPLCIRLFFQPVTTPCGHTFCKSCLERSLDHNLRCPLCKHNLHEFLKNRKYNCTFLLEEIMSKLFPVQLEERKQVHDSEMAELSNLTKDIPIFVCTMAYPGVPCPLHVFEPRYRLMMRRCMETGTKKFGMCTFEDGKGFAGYGCMLEILGLDVLPDGRSYVNCIGRSRFRVLKRSHRDGYHTADIEYLEDQKVEGADLEVLKCLHDSVYQQAYDWFHRLTGRIQGQISMQHGLMPDKEEDIQASPDGPAWCWWLLSVLQLDPAYQTTVLSLTLLQDRLGHLRNVLEFFSQNQIFI
ncbi:LON peptidase N-terminal domain and RING finger protein 1 isoform X1 [Polyodon spathula]|uniref:LON peptidase N-terminal domain and RING finger protein 1 isoform X1 n=1 Tax=Polyodon spathula TaxID=7913 RepID=UPI001B7F4168|nr:LON peptidase N-terminal domain and RING finger protein 1 isoform X1 [Polyodon spathula]